MQREGLFRHATDQRLYNDAERRMRKDSLRTSSLNARKSLVIGDGGIEASLGDAFHSAVEADGDDDECPLILNDTDAVAAVLKMYLLNLPEPVITFHAFDIIKVATASLEEGALGRDRSVRSHLSPFTLSLCVCIERWRSTAKDALMSMPAVNKLTLFFLIDFLREVASFEDQNKMGVSNLAVIFGPVLMRSDDTACAHFSMDDMLMEAKLLTKTAQCIIEDFAHIKGEGIASSLSVSTAICKSNRPFQLQRFLI